MTKANLSQQLESSESVRLDQYREARLVVLDISIGRGLADADAGSTKPAEEVFSRLEDKYRARGEDLD